MTNKKRITSFLLAFVMMFTVLAGTISSADDPVTSTKIDTKVKITEIKVGDADAEAITPTDANIKDYKLIFEDQRAVNGTNEVIEASKVTTDLNGDTADATAKFKLSSVGKYKVISVQADDLTAATDGIFTANKPNINLKVVLEEERANIQVSDFTYPDKVEPADRGIVLTLQEKGKTLVENIGYSTNKSIFKRTDYTLEFNQVPEGYEVYVKDGDKVVNNKFIVNVTEDKIYKFELKEKVIGDYTTRLNGKNRFETAVKVAKETFNNKETAIVIANGNVSADALSVGPLANELRAPILLVEKDSISEAALEYIGASDATKLYIVGGTNSVSDALVKTIRLKASIDADNTVRIKGSDRYATSLEIAKVLMGDTYKYNKSVIFAHGTIDADALAASTYATEMKMPIILSATDGVSETVKAGLKTLGVNTATIIGGEKSLADSVRTNAGLTAADKDRIKGNNRYDTSLEVAKALKELNVIETFVIANGDKGSVDALASAPLAKTKKAAILLTPGETLTVGQETIISELKEKIEKVYITGGESSVDNAVDTKINELLNK